MPSVYRYTFTLNNYTEADLSTLRDLECTYKCWGFEVAPTTGTPHLQGYVHFDRRAPLGLRTLRELLPRVVWIVSRGSAGKNRDYCSKYGANIEAGKWEEHGRIPDDPQSVENGRQGRVAERERWRIARQAAVAGDFESVPDDIYIRCYSQIHAIARAHRKPPPIQSGELLHEWYWGAAGSGKTSTAYERYPNAYIKSLTKWWDGYQNQETVIIDDMDPFHKDMGQLFKLWCDRYPFNAETKGGQLLIRPKRIVVTSQYPLDRIWSDAETIEAMRRRFKVTHFGQLLAQSRSRSNSPPLVINDDDDEKYPSYSSYD